jgi:hypothetical protein
MNNLLFLDHDVLFFLDPELIKNKKYPEYFSYFNIKNKYFNIYNEYCNSRIDYTNFPTPWKLEKTQFPIPELSTTKLDFADVVDEAIISSVATQIDQGKTVYLFWSGGIDSTMIAVALLKNLTVSQLTQVCFVQCPESKQENPYFYNKYLKDLNHIYLEWHDMPSFIAGLDLTKTLILNGEGADYLIGHTMSYNLFYNNPNSVVQPWSQYKDTIIDIFHGNGIAPEYHDGILDSIVSTAKLAGLELNTIYDFYWWFTYNFKFDSPVLRSHLLLGENLSDSDFAYFSKNCYFNLFTDSKIQQWILSADITEKLEFNKKLIKYPYKKYIYDFDKNELYFMKKRKLFSWQPPTARSSLLKYFAFDKNYQRYSLFDRSVRQQLKQIFY